MFLYFDNYIFPLVKTLIYLGIGLIFGYLIVRAFEGLNFTFVKFRLWLYQRRANRFLKSFENAYDLTVFMNLKFENYVLNDTVEKQRKEIKYLENKLFEYEFVELKKLCRHKLPYECPYAKFEQKVDCDYAVERKNSCCRKDD